jgi:hypothetical protein
MDIRDIPGQGLEVRCAKCAAAVDGTAVVGVHGPDIRAYHRWCSSMEDSFLRLDCDRQLSLNDFLVELAARV